MIIRNPRLLALAVALMFSALATPAFAQATLELPAAQRVEFNKLVKQRNRLALELHRLDEQASTLLKQDKDAIVVHAQQVSTQDQLDLVELRLAILATRHGVAVPPIPSIDNGPGEAGAGGPDAGRIQRAFSRGRTRAIGRLREDALRLLASIDFEDFLEN